MQFLDDKASEDGAEPFSPTMDAPTRSEPAGPRLGAELTGVSGPGSRLIRQWVLLAVLASSGRAGAADRRPAACLPRALEVDDEATLGEAPELGRQARDGSTVVVGGPGPGRLLAFVPGSCPICEQVLPSLPAAAGASRLELQVVSDPELETAYRIPGVPFVVVFDRLGVVRSKGTVNSLEQVEGLVDSARRRVAEAEEVRAG
jgi:hypothetical protein